MKYLLASAVAALMATSSAIAQAQASSSGVTSADQCSIGYVTGAGGALQSMREYLSLPERDRVRYIADHPIQCQVSDDGRTSGCTGVDDLRSERVSVYDDIDSTLMAVVAHVELDHGTYPAIIAVQKKDLQCDQ
ncbi:hypothetical protein WJ542_28750 [Paraburkholderia sp. B3]